MIPCLLSDASIFFNQLSQTGGVDLDTICGIILLQYQKEEQNVSKKAMTLGELRAEKGWTQREMAKELSLSQPSLARTEAHGTNHLPTLQRHVEGLGHKLELIVVTEKGKRIRLLN